MMARQGRLAYDFEDAARRSRHGDLVDGKVALVTGTGPNIGSGLALAGEYGARVACNDIEPRDRQAAVKRIERNGGAAMAVPGDVTDEESVRPTSQQGDRDLGPD